MGISCVLYESTILIDEWHDNLPIFQGKVQNDRLDILLASHSRTDSRPSLLDYKTNTLNVDDT